MDSFLSRILKGELGFKTLLAAGTLLGLVVALAAGWITNEQFDRYAKVAEALGLVGLRDALSNLKKST